MTKYDLLVMRSKWVVPSCSDAGSAVAGAATSNFLDSETVIKKEVSGRFNSLGAFRGFTRL